MPLGQSGFVSIRPNLRPARFVKRTKGLDKLAFERISPEDESMNRQIPRLRSICRRTAVSVSLVGRPDGSKSLLELEQSLIISMRNGKIPGCSVFILYAYGYPGGCRRLTDSFHRAPQNR